MGSQRVGHNWATDTHTTTELPGKSLTDAFYAGVSPPFSFSFNKKKISY